jgi:hypothetical protein
MSFRLGKKPPVYDARSLQLSHYTSAIIPATPVQVNDISKVPIWPMYSNDTLGDCVAAAAGHMIENWTFTAGKGLIPADSDVVIFYEGSGYVPGDPSTDQGWDLLAALKAWRKTGFGVWRGVANHKITAFVQLKTGNWDELRQAIYLFGNAYLGFALPDAVLPSAPGSPDWTSIPWKWAPGMTADPANGHCVPAMACSTTWTDFISWAAKMGFDQGFYANASDEAYAVVTQDWIEADGKSPSGFNVTQLLADLQAITA